MVNIKCQLDLYFNSHLDLIIIGKMDFELNTHTHTLKSQLKHGFYNFQCSVPCRSLNNGLLNNVIEWEIIQ